jgi:hypothetical protein
VRAELNFPKTHLICHSMIFLKYSEHAQFNCIVYMLGLGSFLVRKTSMN